MENLDQYRQANYNYLKKHFDLDTIYNFTLENRVEVLVGSDYQFHCHINYGSSNRSDVYGIDLDPLTAMVMGINSYIKIKELINKSNE
jgi:hypothetical protein